MNHSSAHIVLQAVRFATDTDIQALQHLTACHLDVLTVELVLRIILSYLPESTDPNLYTGFLQDLIEYNLNSLDDTRPGITVDDAVSEKEARRQVRALHLLPLSNSLLLDFDLADNFTRFLFIRAHRIDAETGSLPLVQTLLEPFLDLSEHLRTWVISILLPLLRLEYEYYPHLVRSYSLEEFENLEGEGAINTLLSAATQQNEEGHDSDFSRDIKGLVGPWMYGETRRKRRKLEIERRNEENSTSSHKNKTTVLVLEVWSTGWANVNDWILNLSVRNYERAVHIMENWDGPRDVDYGGWDDEGEKVDDISLEKSTLLYAQTGLATMYATSNASLQVIEGMYTILSRITQLLELPSPPGLQFEDAASNLHGISVEYFETLYPSHILQNALLLDSNPITRPSELSTKLSFLILLSARVLHSLIYPLTYKKIASLSLFGNFEDQRTELKNVLHAVAASRTMDEKSWASVRPRLLWLRGWSHNTGTTAHIKVDPSHGVFHNVNHSDFETAILGALLNAGYYSLAVETYCSSIDAPISSDIIEKVALDMALVAYDNASNGSRSRGGIKKASDILNAFRSHFPASKPFKEIAALIAATHALSFYSLKLQHGVPFQPVNIRVHPDPILLIDKILNQNSRSYSKLDDLVEIACNLVKAGLVHPSESEEAPNGTQEDQIILAERRVIAMAVKAALAEDDFDTAYSYVVNRLSLSSSTNLFNHGLPEPQDIFVDDITWRAAYQAGHAQSPSGKDGSNLRRLEQRMELLSQALLLAPKPATEDILTTWRECEKEMNLVLAEETEEETRWDDQGDRKFPGGFTREDSDTMIQKPREPTRNAMSEEAPMGLFDVARGAAAALSKSAFPLRSPRIAESGPKSSVRSQVQTWRGSDSIHSDDSGLSTGEGEGRVRKRDMVSNLVTGGLTSGIGWVIGAPSSRQE